MAKGKKKISKAMKEVLKTPKKVEKEVKKHASKHWNDIEEFRRSVDASGLSLNVEEEFEFFKSDPESFKKTNTYKNL